MHTIINYASPASTHLAVSLILIIISSVTTVKFENAAAIAAQSGRYASVSPPEHT
jgi:uncharacterized protein (DUF983 family)